MADKYVATVVMEVEEISSTDVTWYVTESMLEFLGVKDVNELQEKIRNREVDMFELDPVNWEVFDSEVREVFPHNSKVFIEGNTDG